MTAYPQGAIQDESRDPTAVPGRRIAAAVVDGLVVTVPTLLLASREIEFLEQQDVGVPLGDFCDIHQDTNEGAVCTQVFDRVYLTDGEASTAAPLLGLGLALLLLVVLQGLTGLTPGKGLLGIRTVGEDGRPPGIAKAVGRWLLLAVDTAPWLFPLVGLVTMLTTVGHRRVGDMAVKTFVVSRADAGHPIVVPGYTPAHARPTAPYATGPSGVGGTARPVPTPGVTGTSGRPPPATGTPAPGGASGAAGGSAPPAATPTAAGTRHDSTATHATPAAQTPDEKAAEDTTPSAEAAHEAGTGAKRVADKPDEEAAAEGGPAAGTGDAAAKGAPSEGAAGEAESTQEVSTATAGAAAGAGSTYDPQWDPARGTYIVWEPRRGKWLAWDTSAEEWKSL